MLVGNPGVWSALTSHLEQCCTSDKQRMDVESVIVVTGPTGCGKSTGVHHVLERLGFHITTLDCWNAREMKEAITTACKCPLVATLQNALHQPRILLIDSMEVLVEFDPSVPAALNTLTKTKRLPHVPIMCVMNQCVAARFKAFPNVFALEAPCDRDIADFVTRRFGSSMQLDKVTPDFGNLHALCVVLQEG